MNFLKDRISDWYAVEESDLIERVHDLPGRLVPLLLYLGEGSTEYNGSLVFCMRESKNELTGSCIRAILWDTGELV